METILVQVPAPDGGPPTQVVDVRPGQTMSFGRGAPDRPVDIELPGDGVSRLAGEISAAEDYWLISNLSNEASYVVDNPEGAGEYVTIAPRRISAPVPFEFARVSLPAPDGPVQFLVFAPQHTYAETGQVQVPGGDRTIAAFSLDETAKYFLILVALCEPRLLDGSSVDLPSAGDIVERLRADERFTGLTRTAVNHHIDYLAIEKLRVKVPRPGADERLDTKREALVSIALRFGIVRAEHRRLLPARPLKVGA
jgi:serine/threonine-protein kinase